MGSIKLNKDEMLRLARELSALREQINSILINTQETENVLKREESVSTFSQRNKLTNVQDLAFNILREFEKASDGFYAGAAAYDNAEDKISKLTIMQHNISIGNVSSVSLKESSGSLSLENKKGNETDALEKLKELSREGWSFLQSKFKEKLSAVDFLKNICDTIDTQVEGFLKSHEEFIAEFNAEHPKLSILFRPLEAKLGMADGALLFAKEMTVDLAGMILDFVSYEAHGLLDDPVKTLKENAEVLNTIKAILNPVTLEEHEVRINAILGIWGSVKESIDTNIVNGDAYTSSRFITDVGLNIASFFYGAGEVKAAANLKKVDGAADGLRVLNKVDDVSRFGKLETTLNKTFKITRQVKSDLLGVIQTKLDSVFEYVSETRKIKDGVLLKLRKPVNNVKVVNLEDKLLTLEQLLHVKSGCFTGDTLVSTEHGLKKIKDIKEGELVYSRDEKSGQVSLKKVIYTYIKTCKDFVKIKFAEGEVECTETHLFMLEDGSWMSAEHLEPGNKVISEDGSLVTVEETQKVSYNELKNIYNLNIEDNHTYFVSEAGLCVHNNCSVSEKIVERIFKGIPEGTSKNISWNDFQKLMKGEGNGAEKAVAYYKFTGKNVKRISRNIDDKISKVTEGINGTDYSSIRAYEGIDINKIPLEYRADPRLVTEMDFKGKGISGTNSAGWERDSAKHFESLLDSNPKYWSEVNIERIESGIVPIVDDLFVEHFPQYKNQLGNKLIHHHIGGGGQAASVPQSLHPGFGGIHNFERDFGVKGNDSLTQIGQTFTNLENKLGDFKNGG